MGFFVKSLIFSKKFAMLKKYAYLYYAGVIQK